MKKMYESPMALEEKFMANEYVAACYDYKAILYCSAPGKDKNHCGDGTTTNWGFDGYQHGVLNQHFLMLKVLKLMKPQIKQEILLPIFLLVHLSMFQMV